MVAVGVGIRPPLGVSAFLSSYPSTRSTIDNRSSSFSSHQCSRPPLHSSSAITSENSTIRRINNRQQSKQLSELDPIIPSTDMASPQRLRDVFDATTSQKEEMNHDTASNNNTISTNTTTTATVAATNAITINHEDNCGGDTSIDPIDENNTHVIGAYENSPIRKYLRRPMTMLTPRKIKMQQRQQQHNANANANQDDNDDDDDDRIIMTPKRADYIDWDDYFLGVSVLSSWRSKDPEHAEGACIADDCNRIIAIGYSGFPRGCPDTVFPWNTYQNNSTYDDQGSSSSSSSSRRNNNNNNHNNVLHSKQLYVCDAAINAVLNRGSQDLAGCRLYVTKFPTSDCVKIMIQSGIKELIILQKEQKNDDDDAIDGNINDDNGNGNGDDDDDDDDDDDLLASCFMMQMANINVRYCRPKKKSITLNFGSSIPRNDDHRSLTKLPTMDPSLSSALHATTTTMTDDERRAAIILKEETNYDAFAVRDNSRRENFLSWDDYFMSVALLTAARSKDPSTQVGACIVDGDRRIVGLGYNGMPRGLSDDDMPWAKHNLKPVYNKYKYVTHAEVNAILNSYGSRVSGGTLYVGLFPCENCAKMIIQSGIKKVVYLNDVYHDTDGCCASRAMLRCAKVVLQKYSPTMPKLILKYYDEHEEA